MKLSPELNKIFNEQVLYEYKNQLIYTQLASVFEGFQLNNIAKWLFSQAEQEKSHGDMFIKHINDRVGGKVIITEVEEINIPEYTLENLSTSGNLILVVEETTSQSIEAIYDFAIANKSYLDLPFISKMLEEQVEEEDMGQRFAMNLRMCKDLVLFDKTFG